MATMSLAKGCAHALGVPRLAPVLWPLLLGAPLVHAGPTPPSPSPRAEFQRLHPCPANDARSGDCPGYVIDYVVPRCLGGPDDPYNMRWQTVAEVKARIATDVSRCPRNSGQVETRFTL